MRKFVLTIVMLFVAALFMAVSAFADDDFNRANGKLAVRDPVSNNYGPWVPLNSSNTSILSNQVVPDGHNPDGSGTLDGAIWQEQYQVGSPTTDQSWYYTLRKGAGTPTGYHWTVLARGATANAYTGQSLYSGYSVRIFNDGTFQLFRTDANVLNWQDQATVASPNDGDAIGIRANGTIIQGWYLHGGTWTQVLQHSDGFYQSGYGGFMVSQTAGARGDVALDNFTSTMPTGGPIACNTCPDYVEYTGAAQQYSRIKHNVRLHARTAIPPVGATLDPGDVFKINAARTGYDWVDAAYLLGSNGPGFCKDQWYWCGVVPVNVIPLPVSTYKMRHADPDPSCQADGWSITIGNRALLYSARVACGAQQKVIVADIELYSQLGFKHKAVPRAECEDCTQLAPAGLYSCAVGDTNTSGTTFWHMEMQYLSITSDGHPHPASGAIIQVSSLNFPLKATKQQPICRP